MTAAVPESLAAALADRYTLLRELGAGGMATVYLARDVKHGREVAIKVLHPELAAVLGAERFLSEIRTTASLQHPHILPLFDSGEAGGQLFYVMPYVEGETLRGRLDRDTQLPVADAVQLAREVAGALQYAHERGIIHRDIKPENILLQGAAGDQHALVADFGIALAVQQAGGTRMTQTGLSLGTPQYMAPEQAMGERTIDARADVYALGAVTYEMLAGEPPFTGPTSQAIVARVLTATPTRLTEARATVPAHVADAVHTALQKLPADRPATARAFAEALDGRGATTAHAPSTSAAPAAPRRRPWLLVAALLGPMAGAVFSDSSFQLRQVAAAGGPSTPLTVSFTGSSPGTRFRQFQPQPLQRDGLLLFHVRTSLHPDSSAIYRLDRSSGTAERLLSNAADPKVLAHEYLLFIRRGTLMAVRFNEGTGAIAGEPVTVVNDVMQSLNMPSTGAELGIGQYAVSQRGDLVYASGGEFVGEARDLVQVLPNGTTNTFAVGLPYIYAPRMSPAGDRIAFHAAVSPRSRMRAIFVHDLQRHLTMKITDDRVYNSNSQWSADGRSLAFESDREGGVSQVFVVAADGSGTPRRTVASNTRLSLTTWSSNGVFAGVTAEDDIWTVRAGEAARPFFSSPEAERYATFSPDGKWIAYSAAQSNREEVFVRPYPGPDPAVQVSGDGGTAPAWSSDGRSLYFLSSTSPPSMMRVAVTATDGIKLEPPATVSSKWPYG